MISERRIALGNASTRLLEVDGDGPPFVLLHGFTDSADTWRPLLARLERGGRRAVAVDLPGFGTASEAEPRAALPQFEEAVAAAVDAVGADFPPVLVGNSMGGLAAIYVANRGNIPLAGVVPVCTAGLHHPLWIRGMRSRLVRPLVPLFGTRPLKDGMAVAVWIWSARQADSVREHMPHYLGHLGPSRISHQISIIERVLGEEEYPLEMGSIDCPVMFVWGEQDWAAVWKLNASRAIRLTEGAPNPRNEVIPHCGHTPQIQAPSKLADLLIEFCTSEQPLAVAGRVGRPTDVRPPTNGGRPLAR